MAWQDAEPAPEPEAEAEAASEAAAAPGGREARPAKGVGHGVGHGRGAPAGTGRPLAAGEPTRPALRERLPQWVRLRCGIEPRTLLALGVVLVVALGFAVHRYWTGRPEAVAAPSAERAPAGSGDGLRGAREGASGDGGRLSGKRLVVDVGGKVRKPGVHRLPSGSRVADALKAAGGVKPGTDLKGLNRARRLVDGEQIVAGAAPAAQGWAAASGGGPAPGGSGEGGVVSLSSATAEQLETLPGVGPVLAQHILDYRKEHGGFTSVAELKEVNGIGERRFADIEPKVSP